MLGCGSGVVSLICCLVEQGEKKSLCSSRAEALLEGKTWFSFDESAAETEKALFKR